VPCVAQVQDGLVVEARAYFSDETLLAEAPRRGPRRRHPDHRAAGGDLPAEELATAGRVLSTVLARANAELAGV
jgi:hypothetical protein